MRQTRSAGGVVLGSRGQVLVVNQDRKAWSLPKGHIDPGETPEQAARREIEEESGLIELTLVKPLGTYRRYKIALDGGDDLSEYKTITMFLYRTVETELKPQDPANPEAKWVDPNHVANLLTHPKDQEFFETCLKKGELTT